MIYDITNTNVIYLGRQGENLARTVEIDVNSILGKWPNATISLLVQRNQEDTFYLPAVVIENGILKWTISNADTEFAGDGKAEIRATQDDVIVKSAMMNTHVSDSLGGTETDIPDPAQTWADTIIAASVQAKQSAEDALASELAAKEAAESITGLESNIKTAEAARVEAEKGRAMAESDRVAAEEMRETAEEARVEAENERISAENERESAESSRGTAESERVAVESERMTAENKRVTAETARSNAETSRASAEQERQTAEGTRVSAETSRETAENNRVAAETARVTAEQSRASAETARESAETDRQTAFETNEAQRQTAFETAEAGRAAAESSRVAAEESRVSAEAGRVEAESERVAAENQRAETFAGYETRIDAATPDDSTVDGKPWTSRKIVDTLCSPFEVSGSVATCHPVERYPLGVNVSWEPVQEGEGDPSPDNIRLIKGRDGVKVERCGENLLNIKPFNKFTKNGITFEYVPDGGIHMSGTSTAIADGPVFPFWHLPPGKYYGLDGVNEVLPAFVVQRNGKPWWITAKGIFEILAGDVAKYWYMAVKADTTIDETIYPYIVAGTTAPTAYEPYIGDTYTAELPETVYGGEVDVTTGVLTVNRGFISYNGEEPWYVDGKFLQDGSDYYYTLPKMEDALDTNTTHVICSHYKNARIANKTKDNGVDVVWASIRIRWGAEMPISDWKAQLAGWYAEGKPLQIAYELAEPYTVQLTPQQIAALPGVNTLYTDSGDISVSGRTDMIWLTQSLIDRIVALETAAVSE